MNEIGLDNNRGKNEMAFLNMKNAGTARLTDDAALQAMLAVWRSNVEKMAKKATSRGWTLESSKLLPPLSADEIQALERQSESVLPAQLAWLLSQHSKWQFGWRTSPADEPRGELSGCYSGGIRSTVWSVDCVEGNAAIMEWLDIGEDEDEDEDEDEGQDSSLSHAQWERHFAFHNLPNGDLLTLDVSQDDPQKQAVRYFSHECDGLHGCVLAPDLFSFISQWTALGCVGSDWHTWSAFVDVAFSPEAGIGKKWLAWLGEGPDTASENHPPRSIAATTKYDFALLSAAKENNLLAVQAALHAGAAPDCSVDDDWETRYKTAVLYAAQHNNIPMLQCLTASGASLSTYELPLVTVLRDRNFKIKLETVLWLIQSGARIDPWIDDKSKALHSLYGNEEYSIDQYLILLSAMLKAGCNPDVFQDGSGSMACKTTLLMRGGFKTQKLLLTHGANVNLHDMQGRTAMHYAKTAQQIELLQAHGLDVNGMSIPDAQYDAALRPLQFCLSSWNEIAPAAAVNAFLQAGADPSLKDGQGGNAWWYCRHLACAELLHQQLPFDPMWRNASEETPVHTIVPNDRAIRIYEWNVPLLNFWCEHGLDINAQDKFGDTALHRMASSYSSEYDKCSIDTLLNLGAKWDVRNLDGKTPRDKLKKKFKKFF